MDAAVRAKWRTAQNSLRSRVALWPLWPQDPSLACQGMTATEEGIEFCCSCSANLPKPLAAWGILATAVLTSWRTELLRALHAASAAAFDAYLIHDA